MKCSGKLPELREVEGEILLIDIRSAMMQTFLEQSSRRDLARRYDTHGNRKLLRYKER